MLQIALCSSSTENTYVLKNLIQDFLIDKKIMAKVSSFTDTNALLEAPSRFDIYLLDMECFDIMEIVPFTKRMKEIDDGGHFVYFNEDSRMATMSAKAKADYFFTINPIDTDEIYEILTEIRKEIKEDSIIIKIPSGERRVRINNLNYINIVKRCLCYHLKDGNIFDGQTLRSSFEKAIDPLQNNKAFLFLAPSLLINLSEIQDLYKDRIIFENGDVLYVPMKQYDTIRERWKTYNLID